MSKTYLSCSGQLPRNQYPRCYEECSSQVPCSGERTTAPHPLMSSSPNHSFMGFDSLSPTGSLTRITIPGRKVPHNRWFRTAKNRSGWGAYSSWFAPLRFQPPSRATAWAARSICSLSDNMYSGSTPSCLLLGPINHFTLRSCMSKPGSCHATATWISRLLCQGTRQFRKTFSWDPATSWPLPL